MIFNFIYVQKNPANERMPRWWIPQSGTRLVDLFRFAGHARLKTIMEYTVYVIESMNHNYTYTGMTNNLLKRLKEHNNWETKSNKKHAPFNLTYSETVENSTKARSREKYFKWGMWRKRLVNNWNKKN